MVKSSFIIKITLGASGKNHVTQLIRDSPTERQRPHEATEGAGEERKRSRSRRGQGCVKSRSRIAL